ncbi:uncharacterized protein PGRI_050230 [Penicillium griseofulvum]|uniref:Uncharacterized protein n=1 Tax=Penicillium patulum TaxID=5078 RepID=A0A135LAZ7_PENPA|nr:uncharacterized protein PGRI_050230 [Penicillium griseofulvum]KXG46167.1 hypothetical protein PGRI_050230 [Penicillium griseofulvum]
MWLSQVKQPRGAKLPMNHVASTLDLRIICMTAEAIAWGAIYHAWGKQKSKLRAGPFSYIPVHDRTAATEAWLGTEYTSGLSSSQNAAIGIVNVYHFFNLSGPLGVEGVRKTLCTASLLSVTIEADYRGAKDGTEFGDDDVYCLAADLGNQVLSDPMFEPLIDDITLTSSVIYHRDRDWNGAVEGHEMVPHPLHVADLRWVDGAGCSLYRATVNFAPAGAFKQAMLAPTQCHHMRLIMDQVFKYNEITDIHSDIWLDRPLNELITAYMFGGEAGIKDYAYLCANILDTIAGCHRCASLTKELAQLNAMSALAYVAIPRYALLAEVKLHEVPGVCWLPPTPDLGDRIGARPVLHNDSWQLPTYNPGDVSTESVARAFVLRVYGRTDISEINDALCSCIRQDFPNVTLPVILSLHRVVSRNWRLEGTEQLTTQLWKGLTSEAWDHSIAANFYNKLCVCLSSAQTDAMRQDVSEFVGLLGFVIERTTVNPYIRTQAFAS